MIRDNFKKLPLLKLAGNFIVEMEKSVMELKEYTKFRIKVFELIALIWLDDYFDNYQQNCIDIFHKI